MLVIFTALIKEKKNVQSTLCDGILTLLKTLS